MSLDRLVVAALLALSLSLSLPLPAAAEDEPSPEALERAGQMFDIEFGSGSDFETNLVDMAAGKFMEEMRSNREMAACRPAMTVMEEFADGEFRQFLLESLRELRLRDRVVRGVATTYSVEEMDAYLAFARSPLGQGFVAKRRDFEDRLSRELEGEMSRLTESDRFRQVISTGVAALVPAIVECQN
jgi:hypothetical protein